MAIKTSTYYWVECNKCGATQSGGDYDCLHWESENAALDDAASNDWHIEDGLHLCPECSGIAALKKAQP